MDGPLRTAAYSGKEIYMAYRTDDGREFNDKRVAQDHANELAADAAFHNEMAEFRAKHNAGVAEEELKEQSDRMLHLMQQGKSCLEQGGDDADDWDGAIAAYTELLNFQFHSISGHEMAVMTAEKLNKFLHQREQNFKECLGVAYNNRGHANLCSKNFDQSIADYTNALKWYPKNGDRADTVRKEMQEELDLAKSRPANIGSKAGSSDRINELFEQSKKCGNNEDWEGMKNTALEGLKLCPADYLMRELLINLIRVGYSNLGGDAWDAADWNQAISCLNVALKIDASDTEKNIDKKQVLARAYQNRAIVSIHD
jgi:tetratricopeptide (TPR) repeat protein